MEKDNIQKELFEFDAPKKQPNRFGRLFQGTGFTISLSADKLVFISIGAVMLLVVSFALGVEKGKAVAGKNTEMVSVPVQAPAQRALPGVPAQPVVRDKTANAAINIAPKEKAAPIAVKTARSSAQARNLYDKNEPYIIIAGAFLRESSAAAEVSRLKAGGFEAFIYYSEPYYLACAGSFANKDIAQKMLIRVKQKCRDAYVKLK